MVRLWKPIEREITVDGERYVVRVAVGEASLTGEVVIEVRRPYARRPARINLSEQVRKWKRDALPQTDCFSGARQ